MRNTLASTLFAGVLAAGIGLAAPSLAGKPAHQHDQARSVGKASAPVRWLDRSEYEGAVGSSVPVTLGLAMTQPADQVHVRVFADEGLQLTRPALDFTFSDVTPGALDLPAIDVTVDAAGRRYVNVVVTIQSGGQTRGTAISIPVSTPGAKAVASTARKSLATDEKGRGLRILTAVESD